MAKTKSKKKQNTKANPLLSKILTACTTIATIAQAAEGVQWIYQHAWPLIEPLLHSGLFSPERFWWDSFAQPMSEGESPAKIKLRLEEVLGALWADREYIERRLAEYSESDRQRISDAYDKMLSAVHVQYPDLVSSNVAEHGC